MRNNSGTSSVPTSLISEMSLRRRSTIIRFSAWFFSSLRRNLFCRSSCALVAPRGAVPFIGCVSIMPPASISKNSSGERDKTIGSPSADQRAVPHRLALGQRIEGSQRVAGP